MWSFCLIRLEMISLVGAAAAPPIANWRANSQLPRARGAREAARACFLVPAKQCGKQKQRLERVCSCVPLFTYIIRATRAELTGRSGNAG